MPHGIVGLCGGVASASCKATGSLLGILDGEVLPPVSHKMDTTMMEAVVVEFEPGFCFELAVHPEVMVKFQLKRGQRVERECMERIIRANNEVTKVASTATGERFAPRRC